MIRFLIEDVTMTRAVAETCNSAPETGIDDIKFFWALIFTDGYICTFLMILSLKIYQFDK
jgi:hypothetical protein